MAEELRDIGPLLPLLDHQPFAVISDIDGTLAPIVPNPEDARVTEGARESLRGLIDHGVAVAFATGRALEMAREMAGLDGVDIGANHGIDLYIAGERRTPEAVRPYVAWAREIVAAAGDIGSGVTVEDKGPVLAFHYRNAPDEAAAIAGINAAIESIPAAAHFDRQWGRKLIELRPRLALNKGTAARELLQHVGAASVLVMGDDVTDLDMFAAVSELREAGVPVTRIAVWSPEVDVRMLEESDYFVRGVEGIEWLLDEVLTVLRARGRAGP
jgi:trehalose 6-phosphate phosphatase